MKFLKTLTLVALFLSLASCNTKQPERPKTPEELRAELRQQELLNPKQYLTDKDVKLSPQRKKIRNGGLFRDPEYAPDGAIIKGYFVNSATLAKFKDIKVKISYLSKTKTVIEEQSYVFYEYYEANSTKSFSLRVKSIPDAYDSYYFVVTGASPVYE